MVTIEFKSELNIDTLNKSVDNYALYLYYPIKNIIIFIIDDKKFMNLIVFVKYRLNLN